MLTGVVSAKGDDVALAVRVTPRSSRLALEAPREGRLLLRVTAPPADGDANAAVCKLLAKALRVPRGSVEVAAGAKSREKTVLVRHADAQEIEARLASYFQKQ